jgi:hypothetical protein
MEAGGALHDLGYLTWLERGQRVEDIWIHEERAGADPAEGASVGTRDHILRRRASHSLEV